VYVVIGLPTQPNHCPISWGGRLRHRLSIIPTHPHSNLQPQTHPFHHRTIQPTNQPTQPPGFSLSGGFAGRQMAAPQQAAVRARSGEVTMRLFDQKRREIKFIEDIAGLREWWLCWLGCALVVLVGWLIRYTQRERERPA
jgi:hypothetical protein